MFPTLIVGFNNINFLLFKFNQNFEVLQKHGDIKQFYLRKVLT